MRYTDERDSFEQIASELIRRIRRGILKNGQPLPSTRELVEEFGVAGTTIQKALGILKAEGYAEGERGRRVFVRTNPRLVISTSAYIQPEPGKFTYDLLLVDEVVPPPDVADALDADPDIRAVLRHRLMRYDGAPVELSWSYYPLDLAAGTDLARPAKIRGGAPRVLAELGHSQAKPVDQTSMRRPVREEVEELEIPKGMLVFEQFRVIRSVDGRVVEVSILVKSGHRYVLEHAPV